MLALVAGVILYLNKRWCLTGINSLNCCDDTWGIRLAPRPRKTDLGECCSATAPAELGRPAAHASSARCLPSRASWRPSPEPRPAAWP